MYGIWNSMTKRFVFGIQEETKAAAEKAFRKVAGKAAYAWRYEARVIPKGWENPKNRLYQRREQS